jgi:hypothetical protein
MLFCTGRSSLILLFDCTNGADRTGPINTREPLERHARTSNSKYVLLEVQHDRYSDQFWIRSSHPHLAYVLAPHLAYVLGVGGAHAAPVWSYCFTVETELIGLAMLNGAPP